MEFTILTDQYERLKSDENVEPLKDDSQQKEELKVIPEVTEHQGNTPNSILSSSAIWTTLRPCLQMKSRP